MAVLPIVSIIIPHLNQNQALEICLQSLEKQLYPLSNLEVIIVDNGSKNIPTPTNTSFKSLAILSEKTPGPGPARNTGVKASTGEFLFFIDADCFAEENWVSSGIELLGKGEATILGGELEIAIEDNDHITPLEAFETIFAFSQKNCCEKLGYSGSGNLALNRKVFDEVGGFPGIGSAEDFVWGGMALSAGFKFTFCPDMIVYHPARQTYHEMFQKWERHSRHFYADYKDNSWPLIRWTWRSFLVFASIPAHALKIILSSRLSGLAPKLRAIQALIIIRLFRVSFMLRMVFSKKFRDAEVSWNQD